MSDLTFLSRQVTAMLRQSKHHHRRCRIDIRHLVAARRGLINIRDTDYGAISKIGREYRTLFSDCTDDFDDRIHSEYLVDACHRSIGIWSSIYVDCHHFHSIDKKAQSNPRLISKLK